MIERLMPTSSSGARTRRFNTFDRRTKESDKGNMANGLNDKLLQFFVDNYKPGAVGVVGTRDLIGLAIREAQRKVTPDGKASLWSHCFLLGELRWDRRGAPGKQEPERVFV